MLGKLQSENFSLKSVEGLSRENVRRAFFSDGDEQLVHVCQLDISVWNCKASAQNLRSDLETLRSGNIFRLKKNFRRKFKCVNYKCERKYARNESVRVKYVPNYKWLGHTFDANRFFCNWCNRIEIATRLIYTLQHPALTKEETVGETADPHNSGKSWRSQMQPFHWISNRTQFVS